MLKKPSATPFDIPLFTHYWHWILFFLLAGSIFCFNLYRHYLDYRFYTNPAPISLVAEVKLQYKKQREDKEYFVLKLEDSRGHHFYTTSFLDLKPIQYKKVRIYGKTSKKCSFLEFMHSCFIQSFTLALLPDDSFKAPLRHFIDKQHADENSAILYRALFFADPLNLQWRQLSNVTGIAHIIAISGFHLGVLSAALFLILWFPYRLLQKHFFPYRNLYYDLGFLVLLGMFAYLLLLDFQPSFLRAFLMACIALILYISGLKVASFSNLILAATLAIALFPHFLFNIGFILSILGVFYILLFVRFAPKTNIWLYAIYFDVSIFLFMGVVVHFYFPYFSPYQFLSIPISMAFFLFFPIVLGLHLLGFSEILDAFYIWAMQQEIPYIEFFTPKIGFFSYLALSLLAIFYKTAYYLTLLAAILFYGFLCYEFFTNIG